VEEIISDDMSFKKAKSAVKKEAKRDEILVTNQQE
jgi:hypothetical protein